MVSVARGRRRFRDHYYCSTSCRPPSDRAWTEVGERLGRRLWWKGLWRRVDHVFFLAWWHWHFVAGIRWYQQIANVIAAVKADDPIFVRRKGEML